VMAAGSQAKGNAVCAAWRLARKRPCLARIGWRIKETRSGKSAGELPEKHLHEIEQGACPSLFLSGR
jgi:hypothetical protein